MTKRQTGDMAQCMSLGSDKVGKNLNFAPYSNEKAAQDHVAAHTAKGCTKVHQVRSF
jgi:hypothetical protein